MNTNRKIAIAVGALFITATVASVLGYKVILDPILNAPDVLLSVSANITKTIVGVLIDAINSIAVVAISVMLYPVFKKHYETLALGYLTFRIIESVILLIGTTSLLSLVPISQAHGEAAAVDASNFQAVGTSFLAVSELAQLLGATMVFGLTALILNTIFYQSRLVPRWISVWGLIGSPLMFAAGVLGIFGLSPFSMLGSLLVLPLALNEMVLAVWLIVKGFNPEAIDASTIESESGRSVVTGTMRPTTA